MINHYTMALCAEPAAHPCMQVAEVIILHLLMKEEEEEEVVEEEMEGTYVPF